MAFDSFLLDVFDATCYSSKRKVSHFFEKVGDKSRK